MNSIKTWTNTSKGSNKIVRFIHALMIAGGILSACATNPTPAPVVLVDTTKETTPTPIPDTPTPLPATPTPYPDPNEPLIIRFMDPESEEPVTMLRQYLKIYLPESGVMPYPSIYLWPDVNIQYYEYDAIAVEFAKHGYAVVVLKASRSSWIRDSNCGLAWLAENAANYDLDPKAVYSFGHGTSGVPMLTFVLRDAGSTSVQTTMATCPYPKVDISIIKGLAVYDSLLAMLEGGSLDMYGMSYADTYFRISGSELATIRDSLKEMEPKDWPYHQGFNDQTLAFLELLPTYQVYARNLNKPLPGLQFITSDSDTNLDFENEFTLFSRHMDANGIQYHHVSIPGFTRRALVAADSEIMPQVVTEVVAFFAELAE